MIGQTLSHYKILDEIGRGGMGVVYRAVDQKLSRDVALKILSPELVEKEERKARFIQEARAAAALVHPHIATVFEIGEEEGTTFIAMELIEGEKLRETLARGGLPWSRSLSLAIEVAEGLSRAHQKGIVHRDLKPENIMVTEDGHAKIIDFGLAKLVEPMSGAGGDDSGVETAARLETEAGTVLGTVSYMSPEQSRGQKIDPRSDIFSFGAVLYEMVSGDCPFERGSVADTLSAILNETPRPFVTSKLGVPEEAVSRIQRVVDKCLAKDRDERYQTLKDVVLDLRWIQRESDSEVSLSIPQGTVSGRSRPWLVGGSLLILILALVALAVINIVRPRTTPVPRLANPVQVTSALGAEGYPTWSPEGGRLAYHMDAGSERRNFDIWVAQVGVGQPVNLTRDHEGIDQFPSWSPDGTRIAFWSDRDGGGYFAMPALGGAPLKLLDTTTSDASFLASRQQWSPDGKRLASVVEVAGVLQVEIRSLDTDDSRRWPLPGQRGYHAIDLAWSPDGRYLAYVNTWHYLAQVGQILVLDTEDGTAEEVTDGRTNVWSPFWSTDGRYLYFATNRGGAMDVWRQRMREGQPSGRAEPVTTGLGVTSASLSPDGTKLAYSRGRLVSNVWRVPILAGRPATWADAQQITFDEAHIEYIDLSPDGSRLAVSSDRAGNPDLWVIDVEGGAMQQVTTDTTPDWAPKWSPDGTELVFYAYRSGKREVWIQPAGGGAARQLTTSASQNMWPAWSPDGGQIVFQSTTNEGREIWVVPASGGAPHPLEDPIADGYQPAWSPDGTSVAFGSSRSGRSGIWRSFADGSEPKQLSDEIGQMPCWSRDGRWIYFAGQGEQIRVVPAEGGPARSVTDLSGRPGLLLSSLATDGHYLYFGWQEGQGDIWVADLVYE